MIEPETSLHKFYPSHFGIVYDFLSTAERNERETLMVACADHGTAPDNVSFAGTDRCFILQSISECVAPPEDREPDNLFDSVLHIQTGDVKSLLVIAWPLLPIVSKELNGGS